MQFKHKLYHNSSIIESNSIFIFNMDIGLFIMKTRKKSRKTSKKATWQDKLNQLWNWFSDKSRRAWDKIMGSTGHQGVTDAMYMLSRDEDGYKGSFEGIGRNIAGFNCVTYFYRHHLTPFLHVVA